MGKKKSSSPSPKHHENHKNFKEKHEKSPKSNDKSPQPSSPHENSSENYVALLIRHEEAQEKEERRQKTMTEILACTVCLETVQLPHVLTCGHSFCPDCLLRVFETMKRCCPACRSPIDHPPKKNHMLQDVLRLHAENLPPQDRETWNVREQELARQFATSDPWLPLFRNALVRVVDDDDDDVVRCGLCAWEVADGECTNPRCRQNYDQDGLALHHGEALDDEDESEVEDDGSDLEDFVSDRSGTPDSISEDEDWHSEGSVIPTDPFEFEDDDSEEVSEEASQDDSEDDRRPRRYVDDEAEEDEAEEDVVFSSDSDGPMPTRSSPRRQQRGIFASDSDGPMPTRSSPRRQPGPISRPVARQVINLDTSDEEAIRPSRKALVIESSSDDSSDNLFRSSILPGPTRTNPIRSRIIDSDSSQSPTKRGKKKSPKKHKSRKHKRSDSPQELPRKHKRFTDSDDEPKPRKKRSPSI